MKIQRYLLIAALALGCAVSGWAEKKAQKNILFQYSTFSALGAGVFDGDLTVGKFKEHGDFGIGTFNYLDGEMVLLDGKMYRITEGGKPLNAGPKMNIPFGMVAAFESDRTQAIGKEMGQDDLKSFLDGLLPSKNVFYALRISGEFPYLKMRTLSKQNRPYPKLLDVYKSQDVFEGKDVKGTLVGFWIPNYATGINATDYPKSAIYRAHSCVSSFTKQMNELLGESRSTHEAKKKLDGGFGLPFPLHQRRSEARWSRAGSPYKPRAGDD